MVTDIIVKDINVLIQILSRDVGKINSFSHGESLVAFVITGKKDLDCRDDIKFITFELFSFSLLILKSPAVKTVFLFKKSPCSWKLSKVSISFGTVPDCGRYIPILRRNS